MVLLLLLHRLLPRYTTLYEQYRTGYRKGYNMVLRWIYLSLSLASSYLARHFVRLSRTLIHERERRRQQEYKQEEGAQKHDGMYAVYARESRGCLVDGWRRFCRSLSTCGLAARRLERTGNERDGKTNREGARRGGERRDGVCVPLRAWGSGRDTGAVKRGEGNARGCRRV